MNTEFGFQNDSTLLHNKIADADNVRELLAKYLKTNRTDAVKLLRVNGVKVGELAGDKAVTIAFLTAMKNSDSFRSQASSALASYAVTMSKHDKVGFLNTIGVDEQYIDPAQPWLGTVPITTGAGATNTGSSSSSSGGSFWGSLGKIFTPDVIQAGIKTGLGAISTSVTANANSTSEQNALELERLKLQQLQAAGSLQQQQKPGLSTGAKIAIGVGGTAIIVLMIVLAVKTFRKK